jgi:tripartite-type tricarboxylate transporter receptor subunit TctC
MNTLARIALVAVACLVTATAGAQEYPSKPLRLVVGFPPGGSADVMGRFMAQKLTENLGQQVVVENRPGAGSMIGNEFVAKQPADGYTLLLVTGAYPVQAAMVRKLPFDPLKDIAMVSTVTFYPFVVNVRPDAPFRNFAEFVAHARANPGKLNYASSGVGSVHHLSGELFNALAGTDLNHVPFRGGAQPLTELMAGRVDVLFEATTLAVPQIKGGKLRALAVTSKERAKILPDVPPATDALPGFEVNSFIGIGVAAGTPAPIVERLNREVRRIVDSPEAAQRFLDLGGEPRASSPAEMQAYVAAEIAKWKRVVEARKIEQE